VTPPRTDYSLGASAIADCADDELSVDVGSVLRAGPLAEAASRLDFVANCFTDSAPTHEDIVGLGLAKVHQAIAMSRHSTPPMSYQQAVEKVSVSRDLAYYGDLPDNPHLVSAGERRRGNWSAFFDGLSRTLGIFGPTRRLGEGVDSTFWRVEGAIDIAEKRGY
jgi:hypothetical protein